MKINADLSQRAVVYSEDLPWVDSPLPGVQRRMLEREGGEVARATSVVRYAPDSSFDPHTHGDFGPGMYVRNPPSSRHTPRSAPGCKILVKLHQMQPDDQEQVRIDTRRAPWQPGQSEGVSVMPLFARGSEGRALEAGAGHAPSAPRARRRRGDVRARGHPGGRTRPLPQGRLAAQPARQLAPAVQPGRLPAVREDRPPRRLARTLDLATTRDRALSSRDKRNSPGLDRPSWCRSVGDRLDHRAEAYGRRDRHASQPEVRAASRLFGVMSCARAAKALDDISVPFLSRLRRASRWHGERRCPLPPRLWDSNPHRGGCRERHHRGRVRGHRGLHPGRIPRGDALRHGGGRLS
jgi:ChrR Cupin-like domain